MRTAFGRTRAGEDQTIAELWRSVLSGGLHGFGCSCGTGLISMTAAGLEEDLLDFISGRNPDDQELAEFFAARRKDRSTSFPAWIEGLQTRLDTGKWALVEREIRSVLGSASRSFLCG